MVPGRCGDPPAPPPALRPAASVSCAERRSPVDRWCWRPAGWWGEEHACVCLCAPACLCRRVVYVMSSRKGGDRTDLCEPRRNPCALPYPFLPIASGLPSPSAKKNSPSEGGGCSICGRCEGRVFHMLAISFRKIELWPMLFGDQVCRNLEHPEGCLAEQAEQNRTVLFEADATPPVCPAPTSKRRLSCQKYRECSGFD